jgi:hypothetical protein
MPDFEVCPVGTLERLKRLDQAEDAMALERSTGQRQLDDATALMREAAELFRFYEAHHADRAASALEQLTRCRPELDRKQVLLAQLATSNVKRDRNALMASRLEAWLRGEDRYPVTVGPQEAVIGADGDLIPVTRLGETPKRQAIVHSNVRPVTSGPMADPGMASMVAMALAGDAPALGMDGPTFRLQTADPRFDPNRPLVVNGHPFTPATED